MTIPKKIFYVWGANESKRFDVDFCIKTWQRVMPDYEIIEINEDSKEYFDFQKELRNNKWFRTVYERKMYAYVSDYVRIKTLYDNGGIYLDTDVTTLKNFDCFLEEPAFVGMQDNDEDGDRHSLVEPAILGSVKHNEFLKKVLDFYKEDSIDNIWNKKIYNMPDIFNFLLEQNYEKQIYPARAKQNIIKYNNISIYPEKYFIPYRYTETFSLKCLTPETYTVHWFGGSWLKPEVIHFLENKHLYSPEIIDEKYNDAQNSSSHNNFFENLFSIKNSLNKNHKIITILFIKFKISRNKKRGY